MFVHQVESMATNIKELYNKQTNGYDPNSYKLSAKISYSCENINKLVKYNIWLESKTNKFLQKLKRIRERR
jgi:hypothetical protein